MSDSRDLARLRRLLRYARPHWRWVAGQFALMGVSIALGLLKPWPLKVLVDSVLGDVPFAIGAWVPALSVAALLALTCLAHLLIHATDSGVQFGSSLCATLSSSHMIRDLRADLMAALQRLSLRFHDSHRVGDLVHRVSWNSTAVETAFQSGFMGVIKSTAMLISMFVIMFFLSPLLTLVALGVVPLLLLTISRYARRIQRASWKHQSQEGEVSARVQEMLGAIRLIKTFQRERHEHERFTRTANESVKTRLRTRVTEGSFGFLTAASLALGTAVLFYVGVGQVMTGNLTIGEFLVFHAYLAMLYGPLSVLSYTTSSVSSALGGAARLFEILDADAEVPEAPDAVALTAVRGELALSDVSFAYEPGKPVIQGVTVRIRAGERVAIVGETGGGKSTLLSLLLRLYDPDEGTIQLDGHDIRGVTVASLRGAFSLIPQETLLLDDTIAENIAFGRPDVGREEIERAARLARADDFIAEFPEGYDTRVGERGVRLSVGQRQRIAIARALVRNAPIALLDEPTSALDATTEEKVLINLERALEGKTLITVAHRLAPAKRADRVLVMEHGRIVEEGTHPELLAGNGAYARLWRSQRPETDADREAESPCASA